jgi:hypothetical protein
MGEEGKIGASVWNYNTEDPSKIMMHRWSKRRVSEKCERKTWCNISNRLGL